MAVGINNALFQTGQNHINRKAKKDKALQKDNVQIRGSKQVSGKQNYSKSDEVVLCQEKVQVKHELFTSIICLMPHLFPFVLVLSNISFRSH